MGVAVARMRSSASTTPLPSPPPQGGREHTEPAARQAHRVSRALICSNIDTLTTRLTSNLCPELTPMSLPLSGLLVVALEQAVAAPMCTCRLADAGARVIKIERPEGDFARGYDKLAKPRMRSRKDGRERPDAAVRRERLFRLAQPRQGIAGARSRARRRQGAARGHARQGRRVRAEPQARRHRQARLPARATCAARIRGW